MILGGCLSEWPEYEAFQNILIQKEDEVGGHVRFRFTEDKHNEFKTVVKKCTSCPASQIEAGRPFLAKHHFTSEQLRFQVEEKKRIGKEYSLHTPITRTEHKNMVYQGICDPIHRARSSVGQGLFYQAPSVPKIAAQACLNSFRSSSREERQKQNARGRWWWLSHESFPTQNFALII
jgi:hypothetical protein